MPVEAKARLFERVHSLLRPGGRFVLADVVVPECPEEAIAPLSPDYDYPSALPEQLDWLRAARLFPSVIWKHRDLAVIAADRRT